MTSRSTGRYETAAAQPVVTAAASHTGARRRVGRVRCRGSLTVGWAATSGGTGSNSVGVPAIAPDSLKRAPAGRDDRPADVEDGQREVMTSRISRAVSLGVLPTFTPAASSASFFASAVPEEPEMIAPAWPIGWPGGGRPGQLGPMVGVRFRCAMLYAHAAVLSCPGMPSVITTASGICASIASVIAALAKAGGTKMTDTSAPVSFIASATPPNTGTAVPSKSIRVPALRGLVPPTMFVPARSIRRVCLEPSDPVTPATMTRESLVSQIAMSHPCACELLARVGHHVERGHHQAGTVADDADRTVELDVVEVALLGPLLQRVHRGPVGQGLVVGVPEGRVLVEGDLRVQQQDPVPGNAGQRVHLDQRRVLGDERLPQLDRDRDHLIGDLGGERRPGHDVTRLGLVYPDGRVDRLLDHLLRGLVRDLLDLHPAGGTGDAQEGTVGPVQQVGEVVLLHDVGGRGHHHLVDGVALDVHAADVPGAGLRPGPPLRAPG